MNNINFLGRSSFPLAAETMQFTQQMIKLTEQITALGGKNYILSGCELIGSKVSPGYIVIDGEILPFTGGTKQDTIYIKSVKRSVNALGINYADVYDTRTVEFGLGDVQYNWKNFEHIETNQNLLEKIKVINTEIAGLRGVPTGSIMPFGGVVAPLGYITCEGQSIAINDYKKLYTVIGNMYGSVVIAGNFKLPDLRGQFIAGYNDTDPDYNTIGKSDIGQKEVTLTKDQLPNHSHPIPASDNGSGGKAFEKGSHGAGFLESESAGENMPIENRPPFYVLKYIIKT